MKNHFDKNGNYINVENLSLAEIYNRGYQDGSEDGLNGIRPHGKWEEDWQEGLDFMSRKGWKCPFCKWRTTYGESNFCMNCGADLRKGGAE